MTTGKSDTPNKLRYLIVGALMGMIVGGIAGFWISNWSHDVYDEALEDYYVGGRIYHLLMSTDAIRTAEDRNYERLYRNQAMAALDNFLMLVDLHRSGQYPEQDDAMRRQLAMARAFILERPEMFEIDDIVAPESVRERINKPWMTEDPASNRLIDQQHQLLHDALHYVRDLEGPAPEAPTEPK